MRPGLPDRARARDVRPRGAQPEREHAGHRRRRRQECHQREPTREPELAARAGSSRVRAARARLADLWLAGGQPVAEIDDACGRQERGIEERSKRSTRDPVRA
jgi:hypothetical protein